MAGMCCPYKFFQEGIISTWSPHFPEYSVEKMTESSGCAQSLALFGMRLTNDVPILPSIIIIDSALQQARWIMQDSDDRLCLMQV
jgi:hypothetical protein